MTRYLDDSTKIVHELNNRTNKALVRENVLKVSPIQRVSSYPDSIKKGRVVNLSCQISGQKIKNLISKVKSSKA